MKTTTQSICEHCLNEIQEYNLSKQDLQACIHDGLGFIWKGEYANFCLTHREDETLLFWFQEVKAAFLESEQSAFVKTSIEKMDLETACYLDERVTPDNGPFSSRLWYLLSSKNENGGIPIHPYKDITDRTRLVHLFGLVSDIVQASANAAYSNAMNAILEDMQMAE